MNRGDAAAFLISGMSSGFGRLFPTLRSRNHFGDDEALSDPVRNAHEAKSEREVGDRLGPVRGRLADWTNGSSPFEPASRSTGFPDPT